MEEKDRQRDIVPSMDPSELTTSQLYREIASLKEVVYTRFDAMDKAIELFQDNLTRVPTDVDKQVGNLKELHNEKFASVQIQLHERTLRVDQTTHDSKMAVDAALQAAKEAVTKSEMVTMKQIDSILTLVNSSNAAQTDKIDDIKGRLTLIEGRAVGSATTQTSTALSNSFVLGLVATLISLAGLIIVMIKMG
jgi:hypothetical protein